MWWSLVIGCNLGGNGKELKGSGGQDLRVMAYIYYDIVQFFQEIIEIFGQGSDCAKMCFTTMYGGITILLKHFR